MSEKSSAGDRDHGRADSEDESEGDSESEGMSWSEGESESEGMCESEGDNENEGESESGQKFSVGDKVRCHWYQDGSENQWYDCVVLCVDNKSGTAHVKCCDDGDEEENMSWDWMVKI